MRRNVRRLNREIGNHGSSLPVSTQVSLPLTLPTSYQPRSQEKKIINNMKSSAQVAAEPEPVPVQAAMMPIPAFNVPSVPIVDSGGSISRSILNETSNAPYGNSPPVDAPQNDGKLK